MKFSRKEILEIMNAKRYPRSSKYDPDWILQNSMGSHTLWLQESIAQAMDLKPDMRVLDMGCGKAISSIFLAKEFGVRVWAADVSNKTTDNWKRSSEMGVSDLVCPIRADARDLPFAEGFFDAMVSVNSLFYYVADEEFLRERLLKFVRPGGEIGVILPGFVHEYSDGLPDSYKPYAEGFGLNSWHTADWWKGLFEKTGAVDIVLADNLADNEGMELYQKSSQMFNAHEEPFNVLAWDDMTFSRIIARRKK